MDAVEIVVTGLYQVTEQGAVVMLDEQDLKTLDAFTPLLYILPGVTQFCVQIVYVSEYRFGVVSLY